MKVLVDPGHGGPFTGACVNGVRESDVNLAVGRLLMQNLRTRGKFAWLTRDADYALYEYDRFTDISRRAQMAGQAGVDVLISLHCNNFGDPSVRGFEVWTTVGQNNSDNVAEEVIKVLRDRFPWKRLRADTMDGDLDKEKDYNIIKEAPTRAILVEMCFLSNDAEREWITNHDNQLEMADALAEGLCVWEKKYLTT